MKSLGLDCRDGSQQLPSRIMGGGRPKAEWHSWFVIAISQEKWRHLPQTTAFTFTSTLGCNTSPGQGYEEKCIVSVKNISLYRRKRRIFLTCCYNKSQQDALFLNFILENKSTCFGQTYCPSSGFLILYSQQ